MAASNRARSGVVLALAFACAATAPAARAADVSADWVFNRGGYVAFYVAAAGERNEIEATLSANRRQAILSDPFATLRWKAYPHLGICQAQGHQATCQGFDIALLYDFLITPDGGGPAALNHPYTAIDVSLGDGNDRYVTSTTTPTIHHQIIAAGDGDDDLTLRRGDDAQVDVGAGNDRVTIDDAASQVKGGEGNDSIDVDNAVRDTITCGPGVDRVRADPEDAVASDCEQVSRA